MRFSDLMIPDGDMRRTREGFVVLTARVARGGNVQTYMGAELGLPDRETVRVYRPEDEVFRKDALASYAGITVTLGHPQSDVGADTWRDVGVGEVGEEVARDGEFIRVPMLLRDAAAIAAVEAGTRELSMGYDAHVSLEDGTSPAGEHYDAVMSDFRMNHVAIVPRARGGKELRIGDDADKWGASPVTTADGRRPVMADNLQTVVVGDEAVNTTAEGARAIEKLKAAVAAKDAAAAEAQTAHDAAIAAKDEEIGQLKADLAAAKDAAKIDVDKLVADRAALVAAVKLIDADIDPTGKSDADLRKAAVVKRLGDEAVTGASDAEILGMFKAISREKRDLVADALRTGPAAPNDASGAAQAAWSKSVTDLNAWRA